jgi:beta-lactamase class A
MATIVTGDRRIRAGLPPGWTIADKTGAGDYASTNDIGVASGPDGEQILLAVMTRTRTDNPKAARSDALIADVTALAVPWLLGRG